jgi:long-subunit fatty acid transport protein
MEYRKSSRTKLRAGLGYISSPVPSSTWEPSIPDADSFIVSAGGEFETGFGTLGLGMGVNILKSIERGMPYAGKYESKGYFISFGYRKKL